MQFLERRIEKTISEIEPLIYDGQIDFVDMQIRPGELTKPFNPEKITDNWQDYSAGTPWGNSADGVYALFKTKIIVPDKFDGRAVVLELRTNKGGWCAINPQMLLYINGQEYQGIDTNHTIVHLCEKAIAGQQIDVTIYAFSGLSLNGLYPERRLSAEVGLYLSMKTVCIEVEELYYNLQIPLELLYQLSENSKEREELLSLLNDTINIIDLREIYSNEFFVSINRANNFIEQNLHTKKQEDDATVTAIGHTHIDVAWLWRYCHTRDKASRSFATVLRLMDMYPDYVFVSSQPQLYEYIKQDFPRLYERIKEKVISGQWIPEGGMWVEPDCNLPSGESLVRQFLYGKHFFKKEFSVDTKILWLPDVFGFNGNLPQIMKKSGVEYFMTAKLAYNETNPFPYHTFIWKGIDGSEVFAHLIMNHKCCYNAMASAEDIVGEWNNYKHKNINDNILMAYGYGDGGGGPTKAMLKSIKKYQNGLPGAPVVKPESPLEFFERLSQKVNNHKRLPKWHGELYLEWHRGTYTSIARNKKYNRKAEFLYMKAEWIAALNSMISGEPYPDIQLKQGWKNILLNQFHDVLPGSSIKAVYDDSDEIYENVFKTGETIENNSINNILSEINSTAESIVVINPLSNRQSGIIEFSYACDGNISLSDKNGNEANCQKIKENTFIAVVDNVCQKGYSSFAIHSSKNKNADMNNITVTEKKIENNFFKLNIDKNGFFTSIFDKINNREVLKPDEKGNVLRAFEDKPAKDIFWGGEADNWNLDVFYTEKGWDVETVETIKVIEAGPVRGILRINKKFIKSSIIQDIIVYNHIPRIDFKTVVDWKEKDILLNVGFPVNINSSKAAYDIQFGYIERDTHNNTSFEQARFEVPGHKWADVSEAGYGVSILNDCKYGHAIKEGNMRLTLLRSGTIPNPDADKEIHEFTYSLYPHKGGWRESETVVQAYDLNCPLITKVIKNQNGALPSELSMIQCDRNNVIVETVKKSENGQGFIVRVYEAYNQKTAANLEFFKNIKKVTECNLLEEVYKNDTDFLKHNDNSISFDINPLEIKTFLLEF